MKQQKDDTRVERCTLLTEDSGGWRCTHLPDVLFFLPDVFLLGLHLIPQVV